MVMFTVYFFQYLVPQTKLQEGGTAVRQSKNLTSVKQIANLFHTVLSIELKKGNKIKKITPKYLKWGECNVLTVKNYDGYF